MAQLVARLVRNEKVRGSNPLSSTIKGRPRGRPFFCPHDRDRYENRASTPRRVRRVRRDHSWMCGDGQLSAANPRRPRCSWLEG